MDIVVKTLLKSIFINTFLVITKIIISIIGSSKALLANAIHSLSDLITDIIAIVGHLISKKPATKKYPLGFGKIEYLTNIIVGTVILFLGIESITNAFSTKLSIPSNIILIVSIISAIVKYILANYILNQGQKHKNGILIVSGIESKADALTCALVVISVILSKLTPYNSIYSYSDNVCTLIIGLYIVYIAFKILKENVLNIIGIAEENEVLINEVKQIVLNHKEVKEIKDLSIIKYGSYYVATMELNLSKNIKLKKINNLKASIKKQVISSNNNISYLTISVNLE